MHPPGQRVPRLLALDVDRERRVAAPAGLGAGPLGRGDHRDRRPLGVGEGDLLALVLLGQVGQPHPGALLEGLEALGREVSVGGPGHRQDRLADVDVLLQGRPTVRHAAAHGAVLGPQVVHLLAQLEGDPLGGRAQRVDQRSERVHLLGDRAVVALDLDQLGHRDTGDRLALALLPVAHDAVRVGHRVGGVVRERHGHDVLADAQVGGRELAEPLGDRLPGVPVGPGLPGRRDRRVEGVHERVHVGGVQVVLLVPGGRRQDDVGEDRRAGLPEVDRHQQVELALGCLVPPRHVDGALVLGRLGRPHRRVGAEQVLEEVLVALARGAEQVGPPDRQDAGVVLRGVRVLAGEVELAGLELVDDVRTDRLAGGGRVVAEVERVAVERGVRRHPAHPGALGDHVGRGLPGQLSGAGRGGQRVRAELVVAELVGVEVPVRRLDHVARRPVPVERVRDLGVARDRPDLLLPDVVRPAAAVDALAARQVGQREERAVDRVGVEPVVGAGPHHDHRAAAGLLGVRRELAADPGRGRGRDAGDRLLPGGRVRRLRVVVAGGPLTRQARHGRRRTARAAGRRPW